MRKRPTASIVPKSYIIGTGATTIPRENTKEKKQINILNVKNNMMVNTDPDDDQKQYKMEL